MIAGLTMEGRAPSTRPNPMTVPRVGARELHSPRSLSLRLNRAISPALVIRNRGPHPQIPNDSGVTWRRVANRKSLELR